MSYSRSTSGIRALTVLLVLLLAACALTVPEPVLVERPLDLVGDVNLIQAIQAPSENALLEVGVQVFGTAQKEAGAYKLGDWVFDEIIQKETQFLPHLLKNTLVDSNQWGAIRVIPESDPSLDLIIAGQIIQSDGETLELQIRAIDSSGREWLNRTYADQSVQEEYPESTRFTLNNTFDAINFIDPFQDIYNRIANDLVAMRASLDEQTLGDLNLVTDMLYASDLSPDTFSDSIKKDENGLLIVDRLPSLDDPMMARVADMKYRHHLFIDTVDEYYQTLYDDIQPAYVLWRRYSIDQIVEIETSQQEANRSDYGRSSGFLSLSQRYDRFKWSKIFEREFSDLAAGFNNELAPAFLELNSQVHGLTGTMEQQYREWRGILRNLFELENGELTTDATE
ncbi:MAG: hypothetical protein JKY29_01455 [Gammaproteobacteria bacterium]|nr:hypothetical protein [Gammaproteobacteria bacterium]MBL4729376.1 hypothetical protein [Gammaproteobacteria bacterium]